MYFLFGYSMSCLSYVLELLTELTDKKRNSPLSPTKHRELFVGGVACTSLLPVLGFQKKMLKLPKDKGNAVFRAKTCILTYVYMKSVYVVWFLFVFYVSHGQLATCKQCKQMLKKWFVRRHTLNSFAGVRVPSS